MSLQERFLVLAFKAGWWTGKYVPEPIMRSIFKFFGRQFFARDGVSIKRLKFNLSRVSGFAPDSKEVSDLARQTIDSYFRYWCEMFRISNWTNENIQSRTKLINENIPLDLIKSGKGFVVVATHSGNWDHAGAWAAHAFGSLITVAERLKPEQLFEAFVTARAKHHIEILPHRGGARPAFEILSERIVQGKPVALACDRDLSRGGIEVTFLGHTTKMPAGPAKLALESGAEIIPVSISFDGPDTVLEFFPALEWDQNTIEAVTQSMATSFEQIVRAHPTSWHMLQQLWLDHPAAWGGKSR